MEISRADSLQSKLDVVLGHLQSVAEPKVTYRPGESLAMADEALKRTQQSVRACITMIKQVRGGIEEEVAVRRAEQNANAQLGI